MEITLFFVKEKTELEIFICVWVGGWWISEWIILNRIDSLMVLISYESS